MATSKNWKNAVCHFERSEAKSRNLFKKADFSTPPASRASVEMTENAIFRDTLIFLDTDSAAAERGFTLLLN